MELQAEGQDLTRHRKRHGDAEPETYVFVLAIDVVIVRVIVGTGGVVNGLQILGVVKRDAADVLHSLWRQEERQRENIRASTAQAY
jgi:hypothetical protein